MLLHHKHRYIINNRAKVEAKRTRHSYIENHEGKHNYVICLFMKSMFF